MKRTKRLLALLLAMILMATEVPVFALNVNATGDGLETEDEMLEEMSADDLEMDGEAEELETENYLGHEHFFVEQVESEPDCVNSGLKRFICSLDECSEVCTQEIAARGHEYEAIVEKEPTAEENGIRRYICVREGCEESYIEEFPLELQEETLMPEEEDGEEHIGAEDTVTEEIFVEEIIVEGQSAVNEIVTENELSAVEWIEGKASCRNIELSWQINENETVDKYIIYLAGEILAEVILGTEEEAKYTVTDLCPETEYKFVIVPSKKVEETGTETEEKWIYGKQSEVLSVTTAALGSVTLKGEAVNYESIKLSWTKQDEADGYEIYRKNSEDEYELLQTISSGSTLSYTDKGLNFNIAYSYQVVPFIKIGETIYRGKESLEVSVKPMIEAAAISSVANVNYKTLKISWKKISGANGYEIYRSDAKNGTYKKVKTITSGNTVTYKDAKVTPNKTQYYKVRAYRSVDGKKVYGSFSAIKSGKSMFTQVTGVKASVSNYKTLKISWNKVSGAAKYQIYYSTSKDSGYKRLKTLTGTSYSWTGPVCGTTYYFKVRAIKTVNGSNVYGNYSDVISKKTTIGKPTASAAKKNYSSITISWKNVSGAQKYEIYWSTSKNGAYKKLKTTTGTSYTHTGRTVGTTYYYKVRAIRQKSTGSFSAIVSAKTSLGKISSLSAKKYSGGGYQVSWKAADGATSYKVYRASEKNGDYKLIGTTSKTYYNDKSAGKSTVYYKVQGYRDTAKTSMAGPIMAYIKRVGQGVDVSEYQGKIDWKAVENDGIEFAMLRIVKGTTGSMKVDARFEENYKGAKAAGLSVGVYRYCYATSTLQARREAQKVLEVLDGRDLEYPVVLDMEDSSLLKISKSERSKIVLAFKEVIEDAGYDFAMYANLNWVNTCLDMDMLEDVDLWLARWRSYTYGPGYGGDNKLIMWQYSASGKVDGISGYVDLDVSY